MSPPETIQPLLNGYVGAIQNVLPGFMIGCYLHGSIALNDFQPSHSDIDFITVISRASTDADHKVLQRIHDRLQSDYPQFELSGIYLQEAALGQSEPELAHGPYYHDRQFHPDGQHEINAVTWWILKTQGVTVFGPDPQAINFTVDWADFARNSLDNINTYWRRFVTLTPRLLWLFSDYGVQWAVLGILRQYYSINKHGIASKTGAGEYGLSHLPEGWHRIIREALNLRHQQKRLYRSRILRAIDAFRFLRYIIRSSNAASS